MNFDSTINKWEPMETKKMKTSKYMYSRLIAIVWIIASLVIVYFSGGLEYEIIIIMILSYVFGYQSRRPHPDEKTFIIWLKICILNVQIWHKQAYLFWYPDLKKYRGNPKIKAKVWAKRDRLKELKKELKELVR